MAGDWLKVQVDTPDKPEIEAMADALGIDPDAVFGKCFRVWRWFDAHTQDGNACGVTKSAVDRRAGVTGFANAMESVGWLRQTEAGLELPNFSRHNGQTAKQRALTAKRVAKSKSKGNAKGNGVGNAATVTDALPREEKRRISPPTPQGELEVEEEIQKRGVVRASQALNAARANGCGLDQIRMVLEFFDSKPGAWDGGALYERLRGLRPDQLVGAGWPDPSPAYELDERRRRRDESYRQKQTKQQQEAAEREAARKRELELEQRHGAAVDAMDRNEAERILRERLGTEAAVPFINRWARGSPIDGMGRWELILALEDARSDCLST